MSDVALEILHSLELLFITLALLGLGLGLAMCSVLALDAISGWSRRRSAQPVGAIPSCPQPPARDIARSSSGPRRRVVDPDVTGSGALTGTEGERPAASSGWSPRRPVRAGGLPEDGE